jgi:hypothetical protein
MVKKVPKAEREKRVAGDQRGRFSGRQHYGYSHPFGPLLDPKVKRFG